MKATTIILATVLALQVNVLFAGNRNGYETPVTNRKLPESPLSFWHPATPNEADFEEAVVMNDFANLAPTTPAEATFEDMPSEMTSISELAPTTPAVADFDDAIDVVTLDLSMLAPLPQPKPILNNSIYHP